MKKRPIENLLSELEPADAPEDFKRALTNKLHSLEEAEDALQDSKTILFRSTAILRAAAIFLVLVGAGILIRHVSTQPDSGASIDDGGAGVVAVSDQPSPEVDPDSLLPMSIKTHLLAESDEGIVMTPQGPMRMLKYQLRDDYAMPGTRSNTVIRSVPREHVVLTGINSY